MMKRILFIMVVMTMIAATTRADRVYINEFAIKAGDTTTVELLFDNGRAYKSMQADFDFPDGLDIVCDENGRPVFSATARTATHIIRGSRPQGTGDNHYRIGMLATASAISQGDGAIATFRVAAAEDFVGEFAIDLTAINVGDESYVNYVLDDTSCTVRSSMYALQEMLSLDDGTIGMITGDLVVAAQIGNHAYVTDVTTNSWIRLDLPDDATMQKGVLVKNPTGRIANRLTAPSLSVATYDCDQTDLADIELQQVVLAYAFDMPQLSEVVEFAGYYYDGQLRGLRATGARGQSLTLDTAYYGEMNLADGQQCNVLVGIEVKEPWADESGNMPQKARSSYDYDFQNLNGKVIHVASGDVATGIDDINAEPSPYRQRYNLLGQPVAGDYRGIAVEKGRKILVK